MTERIAELADQVKASRTGLGYYQPALAELGRATLDLLRARPLSEWTEEDGSVLWWAFPIEEPPYVGSPLDLGQTVEVTVRAVGVDKLMRAQVGGWPGYHTHWTPLPPAPKMPSAAL